MAHIFTSYKRNVLPDVPVADAVCAALQQQQHTVFIDKSMRVGTRWGAKIDEELKRSDFVVVFLSAASVQSDMVAAEIETAYRLANAHPERRPILLPVRLNYREPLPYPLSAYLNPIQQAEWNSDADTERLITDILNALGTPRPQPKVRPLRTPGGAEDWQSPYYVSRSSDTYAVNEIRQSDGVTISIQGSRQMGKTSLLLRVLAEARASGKQVALLDFQLLDRAILQDATGFFRQFCAWISDSLDLPDRTGEFWTSPLGNSLRCSRYLEKYLLPAQNQPFVLAIDEAEVLIGTDFRSDFFSMLRAFHNARQGLEEVWRMLDIVLVTSTEPHRLIDNQRTSPFNVGLQIRLTDFDLDQVTGLNARHPQPCLSHSDLEELMQLTGGHPYLVRRSLYGVATGQLTAAKLFADATTEGSPFRDHLEYYLYYLRHRQDWVDCLLKILRGDPLTDPAERAIADGLEGAGLVRKKGEAFQSRCRLYTDYYGKNLQGKSLDG